jgi:hypothetical protein
LLVVTNFDRDTHYPKQVVQHSTSLSPGQLVAVTQHYVPVNGKPQVGPPLAVGRMAVSADIFDRAENTKGKAVHIIHTWKDHLWDMGSKSDPPGPRDLEEIETAGGDANGSQETEQGTVVETSQPPPENNTSIDDKAATDLAERTCDVQGIRLTPQGKSHHLLVYVLCFTYPQKFPNCFERP